MLCEYNQSKPLKENGDIPPLCSKRIYNALMSKRKNSFSKGHQEDAEEFLGFLISDINNEIKALATKCILSDSFQKLKKHAIAKMLTTEFVKPGAQKNMFKDVSSNNFTFHFCKSIIVIICVFT